MQHGDHIKPKNGEDVTTKCLDGEPHTYDKVSVEGFLCNRGEFHYLDRWEVVEPKVTVEQIREFIVTMYPWSATAGRDSSAVGNVLDLIDNGPRTKTAAEVLQDAADEWTLTFTQFTPLASDPTLLEYSLEALRKAGYLREVPEP